MTLLRFSPLPQTAISLIFLVLAPSCGNSGGGGSGGGGSQASNEIVRGPQVAQAMEQSVIIAWLTSKPARGTVEFGPDQSFGNEASEASATTEHVISLAGLLPGTHYLYRLLLEGTVVSDGHSFFTEPADRSAPFRFDVFADLGSGAPQANVAAKVLASNPALAIIPGDVVYESGAPGEINPRYFVPYSHLLDHIPFYPALGNHDVATQNGQPLLDALYLPTNDQDGTERYYSFDWGNSHFAALDSNADLDPGSPQALWLERDLSSSSAGWNFVYFHHPPFSSSQHGSSLDVRRNLEPIFDRHHVDIVFTGHDHDYERTFPLKAAQVVSADQDPSYVDPQGTIYIVSGGGGRALYLSGKSSFTAFSESTHHFTQVDVNGLELTLTAIRESGSPMDQMSIRKTPGP